MSKAIRSPSRAPQRSFPNVATDGPVARSAAAAQWRRFAAIASLLLYLTIWQPVHAGTVKVGVLKFGTVSWELDVIKHNGFDSAEGTDLQVVELATNNATAVALQAEAVDVIVTDWLWVTRQRAEGAGYTFVPYSTSVGSLVVPADSSVRDLADLRGKRLGIAGGPVDKSWLVFRALSQKRHHVDLDAAVEKVFGAPPLLNEQIEMGKIDAVINNWNFVAQLEAKGFRKLIGAGEAARELGITSDVPLLGYVFDEAWAVANRGDIVGMVRASRRAKQLLASSDSEWERLRPLMRAPDEVTFRALRDEFRRGIPERWGAVERADAARLFVVMAALGGEELVGKSRTLQPGTFWSEVVY